MLSCLALFYCFIVGIVQLVLSQPITWTGGWAGISLNGSETDIYSVSNPKGGIAQSFWITGGNKTWIDNAIVSYYIDGEEIPSIQFQVNMVAGTGFVDTTPVQTEINSGWGGKYIGKGSGKGGWYNNFKIPFDKSFRATIRSYLDCVTKSYGLFSGIDFVEYNITNGQYDGLSLNECQSRCTQNNECVYYTFYSTNNPTKCLLKTSMKGMIPSIPSVYSGDTDAHLCKDELYNPTHKSFYAIVRGIYDRSRMNIYVGDIQIPSSAKAISQNNAALLQPLDYYDLFNIDGVNEGLLLMDTFSVITGGTKVYSIEGCVHFYSPSNVSFNESQLVATGTADYFNSAYDFMNVYPEHLTLSGFTWLQNFNATAIDPYGPFTNNGVKWSAYRLHFMDLLMFQNSAKLSWRNGNAKSPDKNIDKCHINNIGNATSGTATISFVRSLALLYVW